MKAEGHTCNACHKTVKVVRYAPYYMFGSNELRFYQICKECIKTFEALGIEFFSYKSEKEGREKHK